MTELYLIYDDRYHADPDKAVVLETCKTLKEAQKSRKQFYGEHAVITLTIFDENNIAVAEFMQ